MTYLSGVTSTTPEWRNRYSVSSRFRRTNLPLRTKTGTVRNPAAAVPNLSLIRKTMTTKEVVALSVAEAMLSAGVITGGGVVGPGSKKRKKILRVVVVVQWSED